jgi:thioredoxin reductase (NADPH)
VATYDVIVIGEGVSGLEAAQTLAKARLKVATIEAQLFGGLIINVNELDPAPPGRPTSGAELASEMMQASSDAGAASIQEPVTSVRAGAELIEVATASETHRARHVLVASGARLKKLGVPGETEFEGRGVSQCADCDGPMYQNEEAIVVGGGDSALQEALVLAQYCRKVHLVHRRDAFRAAAHFAEQVTSNPKISIIWNATVEEVLGSQMVERARVKHADGKTQELACAGVFAYIGLEANPDNLPAEVARDDAGFVKTDDAFQTSISGISAIGAVRSGFAGTIADALQESAGAVRAIRERLAS